MRVVVRTSARVPLVHRVATGGLASLTHVARFMRVTRLFARKTRLANRTPHHRAINVCLAKVEEERRERYGAIMIDAFLA